MATNTNKNFDFIRCSIMKIYSLYFVLKKNIRACIFINHVSIRKIKVSIEKLLNH